ncbi:VOC family protein [Parasedimentitalea huanghaiensis]|uniref:VOC family protein n=1 Tax=Parasedimentitalea huanghaiensis TaxID=2682100 RepID=A0A6L6WK62_9RHOB|nr:VOC family protein [Zongyanglinia huanghaiensis]MVO16965.1 VOC family protein [Zongyanglinia huanghaiensis]
MELDHLAVAGESLEAAKAHVEEALGVPLQMGGQHAMFGTHNYLLGLADGLYLEAIAIDPNATPQRSPCWFDLDRFSGAPRISNWICRCADMAKELAELPKGAGAPVALTRGDLRWDMAVPDDGILPYDNMFPALIEWHSAHPAPNLIQQGCQLKRLTISHPNVDQLQTQLPLVDDRVAYERGEAGFEATFDTPHGVRSLQ